jgi:hypothetical protein
MPEVRRSEDVWRASVPPMLACLREEEPVPRFGDLNSGSSLKDLNRLNYFLVP